MAMMTEDTDFGSTLYEGVLGGHAEGVERREFRRERACKHFGWCWSI